ncbi:MAG TPA: hypothetical protein VGT79_11340, partial [Xanthomonadaceae bacterium]|nr:hypothetical protein [Xanthomonadaceae bacterium]
MKFQTLLICLMLLTLVGCVQQESIRHGTINWQLGQTYAQVRSDEHCKHWLEATDHLGAICSFGNDVSRVPVQFYFDSSTLAKVRIELYQGNSPEAAGEAYGLGFDWLKASAGGVDDPSMEVKDKS